MKQMHRNHPNKVSQFFFFFFFLFLSLVTLFVIDSCPSFVLLHSDKVSIQNYWSSKCCINHHSHCNCRNIKNAFPLGISVRKWSRAFVVQRFNFVSRYVLAFFGTRIRKSVKSFENEKHDKFKPVYKRFVESSTFYWIYKRFRHVSNSSNTFSSYS